MPSLESHRNSKWWATGLGLQDVFSIQFMIKLQHQVRTHQLEFGTTRRETWNRLSESIRVWSIIFHSTLMAKVWLLALVIWQLSFGSSIRSKNLSATRPYRATITKFLALNLWSLKEIILCHAPEIILFDSGTRIQAFWCWHSSSILSGSAGLHNPMMAAWWPLPPRTRQSSSGTWTESNRIWERWLAILLTSLLQ